MSKKMIAIVLGTVLSIGLSACDGGQGGEATPPSEQAQDSTEQTHEGHDHDHDHDHESGSNHGSESGGADQQSREADDHSNHEH